MKVFDYSSRELTIKQSNTNTAHHIWYSIFTHLERYHFPRKIGCDLFPVENRLNACLNYIEDNLHQFHSLTKQITKDLK